MKIKYFEDTDTLYVELSDNEVAETKELNENLYVDLDAEGRVVSLTIEHAKATSGKLDFSYETVAA
ncbi:DUF2283 domain-containing protein [Candidatus Pacearchaeota archaeon]|nr:MAG: DUF2283 domain-containing protein [Candidatus Pacearchaeota archaeon]